LFTDGYAACTVSSPTRAALMTGKYPARLHLTDWIAGWNYPWAKLRIPEWTKYLPLEEKDKTDYHSSRNRSIPSRLSKTSQHWVTDHTPLLPTYLKRRLEIGPSQYVQTGEVERRTLLSAG